MIAIIFSIVGILVLYLINPFNLINPYSLLFLNKILFGIKIDPTIGKIIIIIYKFIFLIGIARFILKNPKEDYIYILNPFILIDIFIFPIVTNGIIVLKYKEENLYEKILLFLLNPLFFILKRINLNKEYIDYILFFGVILLLILNYNNLIEVIKNLKLLTLFTYSYLLLIIFSYFIEKNNKLLLISLLSLTSFYFKNFILFYYILFPSVVLITKKELYSPTVLILLIIFSQTFYLFDKALSLNSALKEIYDFNKEFKICKKFSSNIYDFNYPPSENSCKLILINPQYEEISNISLGLKYLIYPTTIIYYSKTKYSINNKFGIDLYLIK